MTARQRIRQVLDGILRIWSTPALLVREHPREWTASSPRATAIRILTDRFGAGAAGAQESRVFDLARFQADAVRRAETMLATRRGAIVADDVGLGKTFVALALLEDQLAAGRTVMVLVPAALRRTWRKPLSQLCHRLRLPPPASAPASAPVALLSHARMSLGLSPAGSPDRAPALIVVDEAHRFRNPSTRRYRSLAELCRHSPVVLLTATPVNNSPLDLYALIRLFAGDRDFQDVGVADLHAVFREASRDPGAAGTLLPPVLAATTIRRTRPFIREHYRGVRLPGAGVLRFPQRAPPMAIPSNLNANAPGLVRALQTHLPVFSGAAYAAARPRSHGSPRDRDAYTPGAEVELLRLTLLKRLQSSPAAFRATLGRQVSYHRRFIDALRRGLLLGPAERAARGDELQLSLDALLLRPVPPRFDRALLLRRVRADLAALLAIEAALAGDLAHVADPKLDSLMELLRQLAGEKLVVFAEFRDTAHALWRALLRAGIRVALLDGGGARLGSQRASQRQVIERFAPLAAGAPAPPVHERVDVLVATDVLAEGLNLHDAGHVASYDLPWNPVRLVQRAGRIDRPGSPHRVVHSYYFLPDPELDALLGLGAILDRKAAAIAATTGADSPVAMDRSPVGGAVTERVARLRLAAREAADVAHRLAHGDGDVVGDIERAQSAPFEVEERLRRALADALPVGPPGGASAPMAGFPAALLTTTSRRRTLVACRHTRGIAWLLFDGRQVRVDDADAATILLSALHARTPAVPDASRVRAALAAARVFLGTAGLGPASTGRHARAHDACKAASSRLLKALADLPGGPEPELCARADRLLDALRHGVGAGTNAAIRDVLTGLAPACTAHEIIDQLEAVMRCRRDAGANRSADPMRGPDIAPHPVVVGVLDCMPRG